MRNQMPPAGNPGYGRAIDLHRLPMRSKRMRAFWITLLFYALAGPLVGLLSLMAIGFLVELWDLIAHRLLFAPGQFRFVTLDWKTLSLYLFGAYAVGFFPALLAGVLISAGRLYGLGFGYAVLIGALVGFMFAIGLPTPGQLMYRPQGAIWLFLLCFIPTIVCWILTRRWWRKRANAVAGSAG
jgi:hypothetical protein